MNDNKELATRILIALIECSASKMNFAVDNHRKDFIAATMDTYKDILAALDSTDKT